MTAFLQVGTHTLTAEDIINKLSSNNKLFPKFLEEIVIDEAILPFDCTAEEIATLNKNFYAGCNDEENEIWLRERGLTREYVTQYLVRQSKIAKFKEVQWGNKVEHYFFQERKRQLDQIIYSIINHQNYDVIQELYFRIIDEKQSFAELAAEYSQTPEAQVKGVIGPVALGKLQPNLAKLLMFYNPGTIITAQLGDYHTLLKVESIIPATFEESMRQRMMQELFDQWLQQEAVSIKSQVDIVKK